MTIKSIIPWQAKIITKIILARIPLGYRAWQKMGLFVHGSMDDPAYAFSVFKNHFDRVDFPGKQGHFVALELGPGDSLFSSLIAKAFGAASSYLVDTGKYAQDDTAAYRRMAVFLGQQGLAAPTIADSDRLEDVLSACNCRYETGGLNSLRAIPDRSVDFIWSQAVLEHVRKEDFSTTMRELRRILKPGGACSHRVDLKDHLGGSLNHLRFKERYWESDFMASSGFYTNRIRFKEMMQFFESAGFTPTVLDTSRWNRLPVRKNRLSKEFCTLPDEELLISGFDVILK